MTIRPGGGNGLIKPKGGPTLILVTGQHRSGTSATAGCLKQLGVELGDQLMPANSANPKGYFEDTRVVKTHDRLLKALGGSWDQPVGLPLVWDHLPAAKGAEVQLVGYVHGFMAQADLFTIKDPRASLFMPLWQRVCELAGCRLTVLEPERKAAAVVNSLVTREGWMPDRALDVVRAYENAINEWDWPRLTATSIGFPNDVWRASQWSRVAAKLGVELDITNIGKVHAFLDGGLVHHG